MLDINEIHKEIDKLENCDCTDWNVCKKLAILYTVRNNYKDETMTESNLRSTLNHMAIANASANGEKI